MPINFEDFIHLPYKVLLSVGYDFLDRTKSKWLNGIMRLYLIASLLCCIYVTYNVFIVTINELLAGVANVPLFHRLLTDINFNVIGFFKCFYFVRHLQRNKRICKEFGIIYPKSHKEEQQYCVQDYFWPKWIKFLLYFYFCAVLLIAFAPLAETVIDYLVQYFKVGYATAAFSYVKVYDIHYYIDHHNPLAYCFLYTMEMMNAHFATVFNICPDIWLVAYAMQLCMHFDFIARSLESYEPLEDDIARDCQFIGVLIKKHQVVLKLCDKLREIFSELILIMFFSTAVTLCCAGVYVISQGISVDLLGFLAFLPTSLGQYFMICFYGQQIINKSLNVRDATYNSLWYNGSQSYKKCVLLILVRAQRQAELNAGGFQKTNLEAFQAVISLTYRAFAMLNTMFD